VVEVREQRGDVARVVLEVGVHHHDAPPARRLESGVGCRRLAAVFLEPHEPHARIGLPEAANDLGAAIAAPVVHEDDLEGEPEALENPAQLGPERRRLSSSS